MAQESPDSFAPVDVADGYLLEQQEQFIEIPTPDFENTYKYVKHLIFDGFIPFRADVFGTPCVFKALTPSEFRLIEILESDPVRRLPYFFLYSLVFVDGCCILPHRSDLHEDAVRLWNLFNVPVTNFFIERIQAMQNAQADCYGNLESYLYEGESRYLWLIYKQQALKNKMVPGIELIGLNTAQESWVSFNKREDLKEEQERMFEHSKFIVSGMVGGKEIKKIETSERQRQLEEKKRRQDVRLRNRTDKIQLGPSINTAEDLVKELERQIRGEKDIHDRIIEQHEKSLRDFMDNRRKEIEHLSSVKMSQPDQGSRSVTPEQMQKLIEESEKPIETMVSADHYTSMIEQTALSKTSSPIEVKSPTKSKTIGDMKPKSLFDPEIQKELEKLKKSDS